MSLLTFGTILFCALGATITILAYKFQKSSRKIVIPSSYLFLNFPEKKSKGKIYFPPRLILELLFISLIGISVILISNKDAEERELIIFNNSQSMASFENGQDSDTRLDLAKKNFIQNASENINYKNKYKLIVFPKDFSGELGKDQDIFEDLSSIIQKVSQIKNSTAPDALSLNFEKIISQTAAGKVSIYTDRSIEFSDRRQKFASAHQIGKPTANVFISDVEVIQNPTSQIKVDVKLGFSGEGSTSGQLEIYAISNEDKPRKKIIEKKNYVAQNDRASIVSFKIEGDEIVGAKTAGFILKIASSLQGDSNSIDNIAYAILKPGNQGRIFLVSDEKNIDRISQSLQVATQLKVDIIDSNQYESRVKDGDIAVFYRTKFPESFNGPSLVILPNSENKNLQFAGIAKNSKVTSYDNKNPINRYIAFDTLQFPQTLVFKQSSWANGFIYSKTGPIALAGILNSRFVAVIGFEILPFDKERKSASDILLLNLFSILKNDQNSRINDQVEQQSKLECITDEFNCSSSVLPLEKGIYREGESNNFSAVNNFVLSESETFKVHSSNLRLPQNTLKSNYRSFDFIPITLWLALIVLILDLLFIIVRRREVFWKKESVK